MHHDGCLTVAASLMILVLNTKWHQTRQLCTLPITGLKSVVKSIHPLNLYVLSDICWLQPLETSEWKTSSSYTGNRSNLLADWVLGLSGVCVCVSLSAVAGLSV